jgi:hypothetical protein
VVAALESSATQSSRVLRACIRDAHEKFGLPRAVRKAGVVLLGLQEILVYLDRYRRIASGSSALSAGRPSRIASSQAEA